MKTLKNGQRTETRRMKTLKNGQRTETRRMKTLKNGQRTETTKTAEHTYKRAANRDEMDEDSSTER